MHHKFAARALDRVGRVQVRVSRELAAFVQQQVACPRVAAVPQVQHDVLGERPDPVLVRGRGREPQHGTRLLVGQPALLGDTVGRGSGLGNAVGRGPRLGWTPAGIPGSGLPSAGIPDRPVSPRGPLGSVNAVSRHERQRGTGAGRPSRSSSLPRSGTKR